MYILQFTFFSDMYMAIRAKDFTKIKLCSICTISAVKRLKYLTSIQQRYFLQLVIFIESIFNNGPPLTFCSIGCPVDHVKLLLFHQLGLKKLINEIFTSI